MTVKKTYKFTRNKPLILKDSTQSVKILNGAADVYLCNFIEEEPQRRLFVKQLNKGDIMPVLDYVTDGAKWHFLLVPSSIFNSSNLKTNINKTTEAETLKQQTKHWQTFVKGIKNYADTGNYQEDIVQFYLLNKVKESRDIYIEQQVNQQAKKSNLEKIPLLFKRATRNRSIDLSYKNDLYFALGTVCRFSKIDYISYNKLSKYQRDNLSVESFAELCGFNYRKIRLDDDWYKNNIGNVLCFEKETGNAVACISFDRGRYLSWKNNSLLATVVDKKYTNQLENYAYVFYRPLSDKKLSYFDIFKYSMSCIKQSSIAKMVLLCATIMLLGLFSPLINQMIYDNMIPSSDYAGVYALCGVFICILIGSMLFKFVNGFLMFSVFSKFRYQLQEALYDRLFRLKQDFIDKFDSVDLALRATGISSFSTVSTQTISGLMSMLFAIVFLIQMYCYDTILATAALIVVILELIIMTVLFYRQIKYIQDFVETSSEKSSFLFQLIRSISKLRVANAEERGLTQYMKNHVKTVRLNKKIGMSNVFIQSLAAVFSLLSSLIFYYIVISNGFYISVGVLMAFITAFGMFSTAVLQTPNCMVVINNLIPAIKRLKPILEEVPESYTKNKKIKDLKGNIEVKHLSFRYNDKSPLVLNDVSFNIEPGEYVGIVGPSGCGKSTLFDLLLGFLSPVSGKIFYDNIDLESIDKLSLRKSFGVVLQDGALVADSIINNILIAKPDSNLEDVKRAIDIVGLTNDIAKMPMGLETLLSEGSGQISGGQKQRILIARALIGDPKILFLDEATSSLENTTQKQISDNLEKIGITRLVVAHRLSTVINCDKIIVINQGKIVEVGNYDALMKNKGLFYQLTQNQLL